MTPQPPVAAVVVGTRGSPLARRQTSMVIELLQAAWPDLACEERPIVTEGDRTQRSARPLPEIGGKGLFTAALEQGLRDGGIDLAVHSLKDLPTEDAEGVTVGAVCLRDDVRDCLVSRDGLALADLPAGAVVGTSSLRRAAQLRAFRSDLEVRSIRGNVDTRIRKVREGEFDAALLAAAGIQRLGLESEVTEWLSGDIMLPAPGQGALAVQCRAGDERMLELLASIDDPKTRAETTAERTFLAVIGAGCTAPVAAHARAANPNHVELVGLVASLDGTRVIRQASRGKPELVGAELARRALERGADRILAGIRGDGPLNGRRICVTRPREQAEPLAEALERLGATVSVVPLVAIEPVEDASDLDAALADLNGYDWLVFTSTNGVAAVRDRLVEPAKLDHARVAAVGPATAAAVAALGVEPTFVPERYAAVEIAAGIGSLDGIRVLLPQADIADPQLAKELRSRGAVVDAVAAYRTAEIQPTVSGAHSLRRADAIVLASGSAARSLASLAPSLEDSLDRALIVCIGPKTADIARAAGLTVGLVAPEATAEGMIDALTSHFGERQ